MVDKVRVVLLGETQVGKTSIARAWTDGAFHDVYQETILGALTKKMVSLSSGSQTEIELWDTAGQEAYHSLIPMYYRNADCVLLVYAVDREMTLQRLVDWRNEVRALRGDVVSLIVVGNKTDLVDKRQVSYDKGQELADRCGAKYMEVSAKTGEGIEMLFETVAEDGVAAMIEHTESTLATGAMKAEEEESHQCC